MNAILRSVIIFVIALVIAVVAAQVNPGMVQHHEMYRHLQHELGHGANHNTDPDMLQAQGHGDHGMHGDHNDHGMHDDMHGDHGMHDDHSDHDQEAMHDHHMAVDSEFDFLAGMIPHHQEAIDTAEIVLERSERPEMHDFAREIIEAQQREIEQMTTWLEAWYPEEDHSVDYQPMMRPLEPHSGDDLDRIFLEDMIVHHQMAVDMVEQLFAKNLVVHEEVAELAEAIRSEQDQEISLMQTWLAEWF